MLLFFQIINRVFTRFRGDHLTRVVLVVLLLIILSSALFWFFEEGLSGFDAVWWSVVTMTTVGYGDISPATYGGRLVGMVLMVVGIGFLGFLTATIASIFVENRLMENRGRKSTKEKGLYVICGWNFKGKDIVAELRADEKSQDVPIVIIAQLDEKPIDDSRLQFIRGEIEPEVLERANLQSAQTVILLSDEHLEAHIRDAKTILNTLTIKSLYPELYVCVELIDGKNVGHCKRARADEIIVVGELSSNLLVQAALDHGITRMITELVSNRYGNELYKIDPPASLLGQTFIDILSRLKMEQGLLCLAIEKPADHRLIANPDSGYRLEEGDKLVVIASERPQLG